MTDLDQGDASVPTHHPNRSRPYAGDVSDTGGMDDTDRQARNPDKGDANQTQGGASAPTHHPNHSRPYTTGCERCRRRT